MVDKEEAKDLYVSLLEMLTGADEESKGLAVNIMMGMFNEDENMITEKWFYQLFIYHITSDNIEDQDLVKEMMKLFVHALQNKSIKKKLSTMLVHKSMGVDTLFS